MNDHSQIQLHTNAAQQQSQVIDFVKRNGKNCLEIREVFSILLLFFTIVGLPSTASAKDTYSSHGIVRSLNYHQSLIKDNTKSISVSEGWEKFAQGQQEWAEQQRRVSEQFTQGQQEWAEQQRRVSEKFTQGQQEWAEQQRQASEQFTQGQQEWAEQQRRVSEQFTPQEQEWIQKEGNNWEWKWEIRF